MAKIYYIICSKCKRPAVDRRIKGIILKGTSTKMVCQDCNISMMNKYGQPLAEMCRECCPTGHSTRFEGEEDA